MTTEPMTEAGRALVDEFKGYGEAIDLTKDVLAIEAEAEARATPELEGYWEKAYWQVVPVLQAALVAKQNSPEAAEAVRCWLANVVRRDGRGEHCGDGPTCAYVLRKAAIA